MLDKSALMVSVGAVLSDVKTLADGKEHTLYFKAKSTTEVATFLGAERRDKDETEADDLAREGRRAKFIATSLCEEDGSVVMTLDEAMQIPATLKPELCQMIVAGSNKPAGAGKA